MDVDDVATAPADVVINSKLNSATATLPVLVPATDRGSGMFFSKVSRTFALNYISFLNNMFVIWDTVKHQ